jgi:hypothetical protein
MRFFRSIWLQRILVSLLLVLLSAGPFGLIEQPRRGKDNLVIHIPRLLVELGARIDKPQIKYGFDVIRVSAVTIFTKIISDEYIPGTSLDPLSADFLTYPDRGPPRLMTIL